MVTRDQGQLGDHTHPHGIPEAPSVDDMPRTTLTWFTVAAVLGTVHAAASLYWAMGGSMLATTVGAWAVAWRGESPGAAGTALAAIGLVKLAAAGVPWTAARSGGPRGALRLLCWAGSALLVTYGLANTVGANLALSGLVGPVTDLAATRGHAWLWDPIFLAWGLALGVGLWQTRRAPTSTQKTVSLASTEALVMRPAGHRSSTREKP